MSISFNKQIMSLMYDCEQDEGKLRELWEEMKLKDEEKVFHTAFKFVFDRRVLKISPSLRTKWTKFFEEVSSYVKPVLHKEDNRCIYKLTTNPAGSYQFEKGWNCRFCAPCPTILNIGQFTPDIPRWVCLDCTYSMCQSCYDKDEQHNRLLNWPNICPRWETCEYCQRDIAYEQIRNPLPQKDEITDDDVEKITHNRGEACKFVYSDYSKGTYETGFECDYCTGCFDPNNESGFKPEGTKRWMCFQCNIDICDDCWEKKYHKIYINRKKIKDAPGFCRPGLKCEGCQESKNSAKNNANHDIW